jgi:hypothetical protein
VRTRYPPPTAPRTPRCSHRMPCACTRSPHCTVAVHTSRHARVTGRRRWPRPPQQQAACTTASQNDSWRRLDRPGWRSNHQPLCQACDPWLPWHTEVYTGLSICYYKLIVDRDCVALPYVDISTSIPPMDEVVVACPPGRNNNDALVEPWHHPCLFVFIKQTNGLSQRCPPPPLGRCATADAVVGLMQAVLALERLSPSPSHTLRPVFVQEFFFLLFLTGHSSFVYLSARQDDVKTTHFSTATTRSTLILVILVLRGYHLHVELVDFYSSHNICAITTL